MDLRTSYRLTRLRMWDAGHSFAEIDAMSVKDFGDVIGFWAETAKADEKLSNRERGLKGTTLKGKK
jgi:hypothetical protein